MRVLSSDEMRKADEITIKKIGIPGVVLMEQTGYKCYKILQEKYTDLRCKNILIVCGKGNNGGDGYVIARYLYDKLGVIPSIAVLDAAKTIKGDAGINLQVLQKKGLKPVYLKSFSDFKKYKSKFNNFDIIIDAIFGTGIKGQVRGYINNVIQEINRTGAEKISIDIPSGLSCDSGKVKGNVVKADMTIAIAAYKRCFYLLPAAEYCGKIKLVEIQISDETIIKVNSGNKIELLEKNILDLYRKRNRFFHKGRSGKVCIIGGSAGLTGAPVLTSEAASKSGAGLVTLICPDILNSILETKLTEVMTCPVKSSDRGQILNVDSTNILEKIQDTSAVAVGPGLGISRRLTDLMKVLITTYKKPLIIDADGLNNLKPVLNCIKFRPDIILTPHIGEFSNLFSIDKKTILENRFECLRKITKKYNCTIVLKDFITTISFPDGGIYVNTTGNEYLSTGGSGDILTGIITGLMPQTKGFNDAIKLGVYLHGCLADYLKKEKAFYPAAMDLLNSIPPTFKNCLMYS